MRWTVFAVALLLLSGLSLLGGSSRPISDFKLKDIAGKSWALHDLKDRKAIVVVFLGTQCPINNAYLPRLNQLNRDYAGKGVQFLAINANEHDTAEAVAVHAKKYAIRFPVLRDANHVAADRLGAERTPEAFVLDGALQVRYRGRVDDQFGVGFQRPQPTRHDLAEAIDAVLAGKAVAPAKTEVQGCLITRAPVPKNAATVTYARNVARIMQRHCQECHRPGQIGPMPLLTYDDVSAWSQMIREVVEDRRMPPWHADPKHGKFRNDRSMPAGDRAALLAWIDEGCPRGDERDLPPARAFPEGWRIGAPDAVFTMTKEFTVPAKAPKTGIRYKHFLVPTNFKEDVWVQAVEAKPGNPAVVHHMLVYVLTGGKRQMNLGDGFGNGLLVAQAPGDMALIFPPGHAKRIPKGSTLAFQMHYTPNGTEQIDRSSVGLVFAKEPPRHAVKTRAISQTLLVIPAGAEAHKTNIASTFKQNTRIVSLLPHMHLRGKSFTFQAVYPDGKRQLLLSVPRYDFGWQANYVLDPPLELPAGSKIECTATFDNSASNPNNPDPARWVFWGEQTWDEMMIGFVDYTYVDEPPAPSRK